LSCEEQMKVHQVGMEKRKISGEGLSKFAIYSLQF
jgi:hypothetical protein